MPTTKRQKQKPSRRRTLPEAIRAAIERELTKMQESSGHIGDQWTGPALASWVTPGVMRSVSRWLRAL